ncbi:MAG: hypothetical protein K6G28_05190 [Acholeplasmatales bacterium]|nr:hypothetical protein [Acholeplasmatales bacterium]
MKVRSYDALTDYDKIIGLVKQEKLTALYRKDKVLYKEAMSNSETFVLENEGEIIGFMRCISDFTYTTYVMEVVAKEGTDKKEVFGLLLGKAERLALHGNCNIIADEAFLEDIGIYAALGYKYSGSGLRKSYIAKK